VSTVQPVRRALRTLWLATFPPTGDVQVMLGRRGPGRNDRRLCIGDATGTAEPEALGPRRPMLEEYEVLCIASVTTSLSSDDDDQASVTDDVVAIQAAAEQALRGNPTQTLGVAGVEWLVIAGDWSLRETPASETGGPLSAVYEFRVRVRARYQLT
jgi:hypothetical protein